MMKRFLVLLVIIMFIDERSEIATEPAVRRLHGHDRAREERKGLIPRRTFGTRSAAEATSNRRFDVAGAGLSNANLWFDSSRPAV